MCPPVVSRTRVYFTGARLNKIEVKEKLYKPRAEAYLEPGKYLVKYWCQLKRSKKIGSAQHARITVPKSTKPYSVTLNCK